ncbi:MAG: PKD domain-containing protein, partial [Desulfococcaceae bacterium]
RWDFGDEDSGEDNTSTLRDPTHAYDTPGSFDVSLRASNSAGVSVERKEDFIVVLPLTAAFSVEPETGDVPLQVTFTDTSGTVTEREWRLTGPDGQEETVGAGAESFTMTLAEAGTYEVSLTVTNNEVTDTTERTFEIGDAPPAELRADFSFTVEDCTATFTNESEGDFAAVLWDFGDGNFSDEENPTHVYADNGAYNVVLVVATADGAVDDSIEQVANVVSCGALDPIVEADFNADPTIGEAPLTVQFADASTSIPAGLVDTWTWDFGDGGTSDERNPSHTYQAGGTYTATLVASISGTALSDTATMEIAVSDDGVVIVDPPTGIEPADGAIDIGLMPVLRIEPFAGPAGTYGATEWQIAVDPSFAEQFLIWRQTKADGTDDDFMLEIPDFLLESGPATYYWRVRFVDNQGRPSVWAGPYTFSTIATDPADENGNRVPDDQELDDPAAIFPDLDPNDPRILFVRSAMGDGYWALEGLDNVAELIALKAFTTGGVALPPETEIPLGLIGFKLATLNPGDEAKVRIHFRPAAPMNPVWFAFLGVEGWQEFSGSTAVFDETSTSVMLTLRDGDFGDLEDIENGIVIVPLTGFGRTTATVIEGGGGGSDTCFVASASEGNRVAMVLMALIALAGAVFSRRNSKR